MGGDQSKIVKKPPPPKPKKQRVKRPTIVDYFPNVNRKRPKSAHSWTEVQLVTTLGKVSPQLFLYSNKGSELNIRQSDEIETRT